MYYSLSWYDVNHKLQENYCVDVILSLETADDVNSKSFPLDSADIHMKAMLQSGKTKNAANTTSIYESKTRIVNIFYNPYREQLSQSEVQKKVRDDSFLPAVRPTSTSQERSSLKLVDDNRLY